MSLSQQKVPESKSKAKFQSLNINTLYQGAASKPQSKGLPQKHGLQSLGKVPTARRAPASLPSVKSEKGGNDPTVVLVPTGGGWASKDGEKGPGVGEGGKEQGAVAAAKAEEKAASASPPQKPQQPLSWAGTVTGAGQGRYQGHQKSPLFGQEFPSLRPGEIAPGVMATDVAGGQQAPVEGTPPALHPSDPAYGPGPSLRPQAFANWAQGGAKGPGGHPIEGGGDIPPLVQPHKPVPPQGVAPSRAPATNQYKSIMPGFMEALELPAGPPASYTQRRPAPRNGGGGRQHREQRARPQIIAEDNRPSIIDQDKLKGMDDVGGGDDWTYEDDDFDYNKKLESEDEDAVEVVAAPVADPNWADQVPSGESQGPAQPKQPQYNFYDEFKQKGGVGFGVDEEEKRRNKKSEEVMKNIERARQRREEEENRYRRGGQAEGGEREAAYRGEAYRQGGRGGERQAERQGERQGERRRGYDERERYDRGGGERQHEGGQAPYKRREEREEEFGGFQGGRREREAQQQPFDMEAEEKR